MPLIRRVIHSRYFIPTVAALVYLILRFALIFAYQIFGSSLNDDGFSEYWTTASQFYEGGLEVFGADPYVEPGYPILIWLGRLILNNLTGVFILQSIVSAAGCFIFVF